jgi:hypothetical protein
VCLACLGFDPSLRPTGTFAPEIASPPGSAWDTRLADILFEPSIDPGSGNPSLTEARRRELHEDARRSDQALLERWKHDVETGVYVEVNGGWVRVDGHRLRLGPRGGEVWLSFRELQFVRSTRESQAQQAAADRSQSRCGPAGGCASDAALHLFDPE